MDEYEPSSAAFELTRALTNEFVTSGQRRVMRQVRGSQGSRIHIDGKEVLNFCSNNYLGLADDPRLVNAAMESLRVEGFGSGASRLVCGTMESHQRLEAALADFKETPAALVFSSGYMANVGILSALFSRGDVIFSDRLNHASIVDGIRLSGAKMIRYPHADPDALEDMVSRAKGRFRRGAIVTDSVFSMDGDLAPLEDLMDIARRHDCVVMIDEAHALGVFGAKGLGLAEHFGLERRVDIQMGTLSKSAGAFGAYACGSQELIDCLVNKARGFIYTTALPPSVAAVGVRALEIISEESWRREQLWVNTRYLRERCLAMGWDIGQSQSPIIPLMVGDSAVAMKVSQRLFEKGIFVSAIRPPTVPSGTARLRMTVMATHTVDDLDAVTQALRQVGEELCLW
jgi:glycine C-acetyltransferase